MTTHMVMVIDLGVLGDGGSTLHDPNGFVVVSVDVMRLTITNNQSCSLVPELQLGPFAPDFCQIFYSLEVDLGRFFQNFSGAVEIWLGLARYTSLLIESCKVNVQLMEVGSGLARTDGLQCLSVSLCNLGYS